MGDFMGRFQVTSWEWDPKAQNEDIEVTATRIPRDAYGYSGVKSQVNPMKFSYDLRESDFNFTDLDFNYTYLETANICKL